jgi:CRISPR-associated protein Cst1
MFRKKIPGFRDAGGGEVKEPKNELFEKDENNSKIKIYIGDWYLNAGIVGFLKVLCDGDYEKLDSFGDSLVIGENFIEFDTSVLDGFKDKFYRQLFLNYFNKNQYLAYINKALQQRKKDGSFDVQKALKEVDKFPFKNLYTYLKQDLENEDNFIDYKQKIDELLKEGIYIFAEKTDFKDYFINGVTKGIIGLSNLDKYIGSLNHKKFNLSKKTDKFCICCQERKAEFELSNAISNIIGFNTDNSNWVWGFDSNKIRFCSVCSLIYLCASVSLVFTKKGNEYLNCFYFINHNNNIKALKDSYTQFKIQLDELKEQKSVYPVMVKEVIKFVKPEQAEKILKNISFIEIEESGMGGQSTKGYNVYSFSLSHELATFINSNISKIPTGYYKIEKNYFDIEEEILRATIERKLGYKDIDRLVRVYIQGNVFFNINKLINYTLQYINDLKGGRELDLEKISRKGFGNGKELRETLGKERENQINGLVYQFLNDLKVADRDKFLDKYLRISMSNGMESRFGQDEMNNKDAFLQFGYSFINGLMNTYTKEKGEANG